MKILISILYALSALSAFNQVHVVESESGVGTIYTYPVADAPEGFSEYKMVDCPELYNVLGGDYGERSEGGFIYFNVPDYRGYFLRGWDHGVGVDTDRSSRLDRGDGTTGDVIGTKQGHQFFSHSHSLSQAQGSCTSGIWKDREARGGVLTEVTHGQPYILEVVKPDPSISMFST